MRNYLLEIGCEEIPARFVAGLLADLEASTRKLLEQARITGFAIETFGTYRRLGLRISALPDKQPGSVNVIFGPPVSIAVGQDGDYLAPGIGFLKKFNLTPSEVMQKESNGKLCLCAEKNEVGVSIESLLQTLIPQAISQINCPIAMRWGLGEYVFIRPVHWILSILDQQVIEFELFGIRSGNESRGHRMLTHHPKLAHFVSGVPIGINHERDYEVSLENYHVVVHASARKSIILQKLSEAISDADLDLALVDEVVYLTEKPTVLEGQFDAEYLFLPDAVLIEVMRKHQKYFPIKIAGKISNRFLVVADNVQQNESQIITGNESVLKARLEDAKYFYSEDRKQKLFIRADALKAVVFQKNLGSMYDKAVRNGHLLEALVHDLGIELSESLGAHAAILAKCDLVTQLVSELPALQGIIGELLAKIDGESEAAAKAIFEHYLPRFSGDRLPETDLGFGLSIADKLDTLVCCYVNNLLPTGSQDPWAVRRNCNGLFTLIFSRNIEANILEWVAKAYSILGKGEVNKDKLEALLTTRLRQFMIDQLSIEYDIVDAVGARAITGTKSAALLMRELQQFRISEAELFKGVTETGVRIGRLLKKTDLSGERVVNPELFKVDLEREIFEYTRSLGSHTSWSEVARTISLFDRYFEEIMVLDPDLGVRQNRVAFLQNFLTGPLRSIDFEKIA